MKFQSLFGTKAEQSPSVGSIANGSVAERKPTMNGVRLKKCEWKMDELPSGKLVKRENSLHHLLLGQSKSKTTGDVKTSSDGTGVKIPLGNGVVLRNMPKIRRPHSKVNSMPVIEKLTLEGPNVRHSLASVQESPHENQERFEEIVKKYLEDLPEDQDPMKTPVRNPRPLRRSQSCRSNKLRRPSLVQEPTISPYKNYTLTTPRRRGVQKKKTIQTMRRKSIHANLVEGVGPEILLRHVEELKEKKDPEVSSMEGEKPLLKSSKSAK